VRAPATAYDAAAPVPLVTHDEECVLTKLPIEALDRAGRDWEVVFTGPSSFSVAGAVAAGLGISVLAERLVPPELIVWRDPPLPPLPEIVCSIYLREGEGRELLEDLAQALAMVIRSRPGPASARQPVADRQAG
jgi:DNA-binding transcriptional LysR family regulator